MIKTKGDSSLARESLGRAYIVKKAFKKAIREFKAAQKIAGAEGLYSAQIALALALSGKPDEARAVIDLRLKQSGPGALSPYSLAVVFGALGDKDQAFDQLEKALAQRDINLTSVRVEPDLDPLRGDPRFDALLERLNLR